MAENELKMAGGEDEDKAAVPWLSVKEEPHDDDPVFPRPIEGLRDIAPSPFLKKTYEMVDDPRTDSIISWDLTKTSFVVWDPHRFSKDLLPTHFKHSNFASFVRQLNTYRFRKIDSDRCEFANELFKHGNKHLLNHIKRRKPNSQITPQQLVTTTPNCCLNPDSRGIMEMEVEKLKTDHGILRMEVLQLRQQQENTRLHLASAIDRLHTAETKQKHMALFFIKFLKNPVFLQFFTEKVGKLRDRNLKKRRLAGIDTERVREATDSDEIADESIINDDYDDKAMFVSCDEPGSPREQKKTDVNCPYETNSLDACSESFVLWEKLMEDDMIYEDEKQKSDSDVVSELENLVSPKLARAMFR